jgi:glycogen debranching enzyme
MQSQGAQAMVERLILIDIKHPVLIKNDELFVVTEQDGSMQQARPGFGLFYRDCCYLSQYEFYLNGTRPLLLMSASHDGFTADMELTNAELKASYGKPISTHTLGIGRKHYVVGDECAFVDTITLRNFSLGEAEFPVALEFTAGFESVFVLRGTPPGKRGTMHVPEWSDHHIRVRYFGADDILRTLDVGFSLAPIVAPRTSEKTIANFTVTLKPQESKDLIVFFHVEETPSGKAGPTRFHSAPGLDEVRHFRARTSAEWLACFVKVRRSDDVLNESSIAR